MSVRMDSYDPDLAVYQIFILSFRSKPKTIALSAVAILLS